MRLFSTFPFCSARRCSFNTVSLSLRALRSTAVSCLLHERAIHNIACPECFSYLYQVKRQKRTSAIWGFLSPHMCWEIAGQDSDHLRVPSRWGHPTGGQVSQVVGNVFTKIASSWSEVQWQLRRQEQQIGRAGENEKVKEVKERC